MQTHSQPPFYCRCSWKSQEFTFFDFALYLSCFEGLVHDHHVQVVTKGSRSNNLSDRRGVQHQASRTLLCRTRAVIELRFDTCIAIALRRLTRFNHSVLFSHNPQRFEMLVEMLLRWFLDLLCLCVCPFVFHGCYLVRELCVCLTYLNFIRFRTAASKPSSCIGTVPLNSV